MFIDQGHREFRLDIVNGEYDSDGNPITIAFPRHPRTQPIDTVEFLEDLRCASNGFAKLIAAEEEADQGPVIVAHPNAAGNVPIEDQPGAECLGDGDIIRLDPVACRIQSEHPHRTTRLRVRKLRESARMYIRLITDLAFSIVEESNARNIGDLGHDQREGTTLADIPEAWGLRTETLKKVATELFPDVLEDFGGESNDQPLNIYNLQILQQTIDAILDALHERVFTGTIDATPEDPAIVAGATA